MTRLLPYPFLSAVLVATWLVLNQSLSLGQILLGILIAVLAGWTLSALEAPQSNPKRPFVALQLLIYVMIDIVRSNVAVAAIVLGLAKSERSSGFVDIPIQLRNSYGLFILSLIITSTPGTVWVDFDAKTGTLKIHVLDLIDPADWHHTIKGRYERLLLEIFE